LFLPALAVWLLFGVRPSSPEALATGRLYGAVLVALGIACWFVRAEQAGRGARAVLLGMLAYNVGACTVLPLTAVLEATSGPLLWPATVLHALLTVWCVRIIGQLDPRSRSVEGS